jgi:hypothetical protein
VVPALCSGSGSGSSSSCCCSCGACACRRAVDGATVLLVALYGVGETIAMMDRALAGELVA